MFHIGDKVALVVPKGCKLSEIEQTFKTGLVSNMIEILNKNSILTVSAITNNGNLIFKEDEEGWIYDKDWFCKIDEKNNYFEKGDQVIFTLPKDQSLDDIYWLTEPMKNLVRQAKSFTIKNRYSDNKYTIEEDRGSHFWRGNHFIKLTKDEKKQEFLKGDKIILVPPKGLVFECGCQKDTGFKYGISRDMVELLKVHSFLTIKEINNNGTFIVKEDPHLSLWDSEWFKKIKIDAKPLKSSELKIGDKLILIPPKGCKLDTREQNFKWGLVSDMVDFAKKNKIFTVKEIKNDEAIRFKEIGWIWDINWFRKVEIIETEKRESVKEIEFHFKGKYTTCVVKKNGYEFEVGTTQRSPEDINNDNYAMIISLARALDLPKDKVHQIINVLFNEDIIALNDYTSEELLDVVKDKIKEEIAA